MSVVVPVAILGGLALLFGTVLGVAHHLLKVEEDPRLESVEEMLPGTNCGACGAPGCAAFAGELVSGARQPSGCTVASPDAVGLIADLLGVDPGQATKRVARLECAGGAAQAVRIAAYDGLQTCAAADLVGSGGKSCSWGCLGLSDCEVSCGFDAIRMNRNLLPVVDPDKCTACGDCVDACPRDLFVIRPLEQALVVQCRVPLANEEAIALCLVACDACGRCAQDAPAGLIEMRNNLAVVDYESSLRGPEAVRRCPTGAIAWVPGAQFGGGDGDG